MTHLLHHFRRNRTYSSHERWGVFAVLFGLTLAVSLGSGFLFGKPARSDSSIIIQDVAAPDKPIEATGKATGEAVITVIDKNTKVPVAGVWLGTRIDNAALRTPEFTYFDWYSPVPDRAFFPSDSNGQVKIPLASKIVGMIEYQVYTANPEASDNSKYQSLDSSFIVNYQAPAN